MGWAHQVEDGKIRTPYLKRLMSGIFGECTLQLSVVKLLNDVNLKDIFRTIHDFFSKQQPGQINMVVLFWYLL